MLQVLPVDQQKAKTDFDDLVMLSNTLTHDEMFNLDVEQLLYRLFHQEEVELFPAQPVSFVCGCSKEKCSSAIISLGAEVINEHILEGKLDISCEYCNKIYHFDTDDLSTLLQQL